MLSPVDRQTLSQQVLNKLQQYIMAKGLRPGDRLPAERKLAVDLGVSCSTIREALKPLQAIGAVSRMPRGSVLQEVDFRTLAGISRFLMVQSHDDLMELSIARQWLETNMLPMVAENCTPEQYTQLEDANRLMEAEINSGQLGIDGDAAFHQTLLAATNNKFLQQFGGLIQEFFIEIRTVLSMDEQKARKALDDHCKLVEYLHAGDVERAKLQMHDHLSEYIQSSQDGS